MTSIQKTGNLSQRAFFIISCLMIFFQLALFSNTIWASSRTIRIRKTSKEIGLTDYNPDRFYAIVIGIDEYKYLDNLDCAVNDANAVADTLKNLYGFGEVRRLFNENATGLNIQNTFREYRDKLTDQDSLIIYYAGHGYVENGTDIGYWVPSDGMQDEPYTYISNAQFKDHFVNRFKVKHLLVLSDSCFSGALLRGKTAPVLTEKLAKKFNKPSRWILTSGDLNPAADDAGNGHSPFCNRVLQFLQSSEPVFTSRQLYSYIDKNASSKDEPLFAPFPIPSHMPGGEFVFVRETDDEAFLNTLTWTSQNQKGFIK